MNGRVDDLKGYRELLQEIELWSLRLDDLQKERRYLINKISKPPHSSMVANYSGMPRADIVIIHLPKAWQRIQEIDEQIEECKDILSLKREAKKRMERIMQQMDRIEYRIAYLRDVERKPLKQIADEVHLSEGWVRKLSMRIPRVKIPS